MVLVQNHQIDLNVPEIKGFSLDKVVALEVKIFEDNYLWI